MEYDFSGYATKNDLKCTDGRTIRKDAFKANDGEKVPLVWQHGHKEPSNVLGHAILENREDGVYMYGLFNNTPQGLNAKELVKHKDIKALSIYANELVQKSMDVIHGVIREVSLVMTGANPGAFIDNVVMVHSDGSENDLEDEAIIYTGIDIELFTDKVKHEDNANEAEKVPADSEETVGDIFNTLSDKQKKVVYAIVSDIITNTDAVEHIDKTEDPKPDEEGDSLMKKNVFDGSEEQPRRAHLTHEQFAEIVADAKKSGSFRDAFLAHAGTYGIDNIEYLFPDARTVTPTPDLIAREQEWVSDVVDGAKHSPFSRIKSVAADLTPDAARAKGYVTGALKVEEVLGLLKRVTFPTTIYKKQKLDRDDIIDITDLDVVAWLKMEMRLMLKEEIARSVLIGDGRLIADPDHVDATAIIPIWTDSDVYAHHIAMALNSTTLEKIDEIVRARKFYKGSGNPALFIATDTLTDMLLLRSTADDRRLYPTINELMSALRVSKIVEVPQFENLTRTVGLDTHELVCILVNMKDYTIGADKGGEVSMFEDFDIDYNQQKYLLETRISGALTKPKSAVVIEVITVDG